MRVSGGDDGFEVVGDGGELGGVRRRVRVWGELLGELGVLLAGGMEARLEGGHALFKAVGVEVAGFEGGVVAGECAFGAPGFVGERPAFFFEPRFLSLCLRGCRVERVVDETCGVQSTSKVLDKMRLVW